MFALVADIEAYPQFVPLCEQLTVRGRTREGEREILVADMTVGYKAIRETFTTRVTLDHAANDDPGRISRRPVPPPRQPLDVRARRRARLSRRLRHRLRIPVARARGDHGRRVRPRLPQVRRGFRGSAPTASTALRRLSISPWQHLQRLAHRGEADLGPADIAETALAVDRSACRARRAAKWTSPTGFSAVPPVGPGDAGDGDGEIGKRAVQAPSAIARATGSLTAPGPPAPSRSGETPSRSVLAALE